MEEQTTINKFYTISEYVDLNTGELISKTKYLNEYYKIRSEKKCKKDGDALITKWTIECRKIGQLELF